MSWLVQQTDHYIPHTIISGATKYKSHDFVLMLKFGIVEIAKKIIKQVFRDKQSPVQRFNTFQENIVKMGVNGILYAS